jgi:hypothetical protein
MLKDFWASFGSLICLLLQVYPELVEGLRSTLVTPVDQFKKETELCQKE